MTIERKQIALKLSKEEHETLKALAESEGMQVAVFIRYLIRELNEHGSVNVKRG